MEPNKQVFNPDRPRRQIKPVNYLALSIGADPAVASDVGITAEEPPAKNSSKKRKTESTASGRPTKSTRTAAKSSAVPTARITKAKVTKGGSKANLANPPHKRLSRAKAAQKTTAPPSTVPETHEALPTAATITRRTPDLAASDSDDLGTELDDYEMKKLETAVTDMRLQHGGGEIQTSKPASKEPAKQISGSPQGSISTPVVRDTAVHVDEDVETGLAKLGGLKDESGPTPRLNVTLKVPAFWFTKKGTPKASTLKASKPPVTPKAPRVPTSQKTSGTPAPRKKTARANTGLPTPPFEEEKPDQDTLDLQAQMDPEQLQLSRKLAQRAPIASKPLPQGLPEVWANSRQALCETVPYFKMPQSGCHQNDGHVYAFLFDGASRCREFMDADLIIGGAGGGMETDSTGKLVSRKNHTMDEAQVKAVLNDIDHKNPLVVICGNKSEGALCKMPHRYNVLGWFKPISVWAEKVLGKKGKTWTTIKYRFERLDQSKVAWSAPRDSDSLRLSDEERSSVPPLVKQDCQDCSTSYPLIYLAGWMCLNPECDRFWKLPSGKDAPYGNLDYNPAFLLARTEWAVETAPFSVKPPVLSVGSTVGDNLTQINTRGMCCPHCGRCNSRRLFKGWKCENATCAFENFPTHIPVEIPKLHQPWESTGDGPTLARNKHDRALGVEMSVDFKHGFKVYRYTAPGINGALVHLVSNTAINKLSGGADDMFDACQREDLHLERRPFGVEKVPGVKTETKSSVQPSQVSLADVASTAGLLSLSTTTESGQERTHADSNSNAIEEQQSLGMQSLETEPHNSVSNSATKSQQISQVPSDGKPVLVPGAELKQQEEAEPGDLMTAFSMNYGMPYKFAAAMASLPFKGSPWPVRAARADLNWASQSFLDPVGHQDMNEELIFGYMEGQKLEYHDDGEEGLGPRIGTLSLGGKAKMHLRMKNKHYVGCSKSGIFLKERPVPGCMAGTVDGVELTSQETYKRRLAAWEELEQLRLTDKPAYAKRAREIPVELGLCEKRTKKADDLVTITLNHGDIVLMEGYDIQQYLEHKVVPEQCLRFALTCRTILPHHLKPEDRPSYGEEPDEEESSALRRMVAASVGEGVDGGSGPGEGSGPGGGPGGERSLEMGLKEN